MPINYNLCMYVRMYACMDVCMDGWICVYHTYIYIYGFVFFTGAGQEGLSTGYDSQV